MKLDLILENVRNKYSLGLLEESANISEKELLQGKILINESTMAVRQLLVEEGTMDAVKQNLEEAWTAALIQEFDMDDAQAAYDYAANGQAPTDALGQAATYAAKGVNAISGAASQVGNYIAQHGGNAAAQAYDQAQAREDIDATKAATQAAAQAAGQYVDQGVQSAAAAGQQVSDAVAPYIDQGVQATKDGLLTNGQAAAGLGVAGAGLALAGGRGKNLANDVRIGYKRENGTVGLGSGYGPNAHNMSQKIGRQAARAESGARAVGHKIAGMVRR